MAANTADEVRKALFAIGDLKTPGPDDLRVIFYKRFWPMLMPRVGMTPRLVLVGIPNWL